MNEQDSDAEKGIGIKTLKKRGGGEYGKTQNKLVQLHTGKT